MNFSLRWFHNLSENSKKTRLEKELMYQELIETNRSKNLRCAYEANFQLTHQTLNFTKMTFFCGNPPEKPTWNENDPLHKAWQIFGISKLKYHPKITSSKMKLTNFLMHVIVEWFYFRFQMICQLTILWVGWFCLIDAHFNHFFFAFFWLSVFSMWLVNSAVRKLIATDFIDYY